MKTILIADDQPEVRELVEATLDIGENEFIMATNGNEAISLAREHGPDIIILDVMMPGGPDGIEVCRRLREQEEMAHAKIIMLTARGQDRDIQLGLEVGADAYLIKPFSPLELMELVDSFSEEKTRGR